MFVATRRVHSGAIGCNGCGARGDGGDGAGAKGVDVQKVLPKMIWGNDPLVN